MCVEGGIRFPGDSVGNGGGGNGRGGISGFEEEKYSAIHRNTFLVTKPSRRPPPSFQKKRHEERLHQLENGEEQTTLVKKGANYVFGVWNVHRWTTKGMNWHGL